MKATRKILIYLSLVLISGLMMIPCAVKQQIKGSITQTQTTYNGKNSAKVCVTTYATTQQQHRLQIAKLPPFLFSDVLKIDNDRFTQVVLPNSFIFFFKEKVPSYILHCLFRI